MNEQIGNVKPDIIEVEVVYNKDAANRLIHEGWVLLSVGPGQEQTGAHDYMPLFGFCLGKPKTTE